jgi:hypothetical protein
MILSEEHSMKLRSAVLALSFALLSSAAFAQANSFQLINKTGRVIGKASYTIDKTKDGYHVKAKFEYRTGIAVVSDNPDPYGASSDGSNITDSQINSDYKVDANGNYLSGYTQNSANQTITSFSPSKPRDVVVIAQMQGGVNLGSKSLGMPKPDFLVAPDYDPSAIQILLTSALAHPHSDHLYLLAVPASGARGLNNALYLTIADPTDATGTLDGKPVALKHYVLGWNKAKGDIYADANGTLMQANIGTISVRYVRTKFALDETPAP